MSNWLRLRPCAILLVALIVAGCGSDDGFNEAVDFAPKEGSVQFVNMMADSPQLTILHGLETSTVRFPFAEPIELRFQDRYDWRIAYLDSDDREITVTQGEDQQIQEDTLSVFLFMGDLVQPNIQIVDIPPVSADETTEGMAWIWFAANTSQHPMVDIYFTDHGIDLAGVTPITTLTNGTASILFTVEAATGKQVRVTPAGSNTILFASAPLEIPLQRTELFAVVDDFGPDSVNHVDLIRSLAASRTVIENTAQPARARVGNYSSNAQILASLASAEFPAVPTTTRSGYETVGTGLRTLTVKAGDETLEQREFNVRPGQFYTFYTFNDPENAAITRSLILLDESRPVTDRSLFKFVNGSSEAVDLFALDPGQSIEGRQPLANNLEFSGTVTIESLSQPVEFSVTNADASETLATLTSTLEEGGSYTLLFDQNSALRLLVD